MAFSSGSSGRASLSGISSSSWGASGSPSWLALRCLFSFFWFACAAWAFSCSAFFLAALRCLLRSFFSSAGGRFSAKI